MSITHAAIAAAGTSFVIMPIIIAALMAFGIVRMVGMGTDNKGFYITGGVCLVVSMAPKQLGDVRGARKRLGE